MTITRAPAFSRSQCHDCDRAFAIHEATARREKRSRRGRDPFRRKAITAGRRRRQSAALALIIPTRTVALAHRRGLASSSALRPETQSRSIPRTAVAAEGPDDPAPEAGSAYAHPTILQSFVSPALGDERVCQSVGSRDRIRLFTHARPGALGHASERQPRRRRALAFRHLGCLRRTLGVHGKQAFVIWAGVGGGRRAWRTCAFCECARQRVGAGWTVAALASAQIQTCAGWARHDCFDSRGCSGFAMPLPRTESWARAQHTIASSR